MANIHSGVQASLQVDGVSWDVLDYTLSRQLFAVDQVHVQAATPDLEPSTPARVLGAKARFQLVRGGGASLNFGGIVVGAHLQRDPDDVCTLVLDIASELWRLSRRSNHRVFQKMSVKDVTEEVLTNAGIGVERKWLLKQSHPPRPYITQFNETDLEFVQRILAEEGVYFATEDTASSTTVSFSDDPTGLGEITGRSTLTFLREFGWQGADDCVFRLSLSEGIRPDKATLREFDWEHPKVDLTASSEAEDNRAHVAEIYRFPARTAESQQLKMRSQVLLQAQRVDSMVLVGETGSLALRPGLRFGVDGHTYSRLNAKYLVTGIQIRGQGQHQNAHRTTTDQRFGYAAEFRAIPVEKGRYRPSVPSVMCRVPGLQSAVTTGSAGDEIHTNEHGQVTVLFPWEQGKSADQNSSCWMRTSQVPLGGSMLLPRMNWEVAISATEGDVDQRMIMSRLYNAATMPPYELPAAKARMALQTNTTPGGGSSNELRMSDTKGEEEMFFNGSKDMSVNVGNNATESVAVDYETTVGSNRTVKVVDSMTGKVCANQTVAIAANHKTSVATLNVDHVTGNHTLTIGAKRTMMIGGDHRRTVGGDSTETVGASRIEAVVGGVSDATLANMTQTVGAALVEVTTASRSLIASSARAET
ncbi:MAG TPA: type VI secretion system tip protein TssI/VgrG, partial [Polyangiaceae bacterium]|nr:type VI secretion system tip protein TssI/VgrG [Polyangiaceae bacterium]